MRTKTTQAAKIFNYECGMRIAIARDCLGLRQSDLAKLVGLSRTAIVNIEQGKTGVSFEQATRFASSLRVPLKRITPNMIGRAK